MKSKEELKRFFENGDIPKQEEFWEWQESYWHKDEKLPTEAAGIYKIKGSIADLAALNTLTGMEEGDVYNLLDTGDNYVYVLDLNNTGNAGWDKLSGIVNLSGVDLQTVLSNGGHATIGNNLYDVDLNIGYFRSLQKYNNDFSQISQDGEKLTFIYYKDNVNSSNFSLDYSGIDIRHTSRGNNHSLLQMNDNEFYLSIGSVSLTDSTKVSLEKGGFVYDADYSSRFVDRSLVDKGYVDTAISDVIRNLGNINMVNTSTIYSSSSDLNNDYPDVKLGFEVYSTSSGHIHKKITDTSWSISEVNLLP